MDNAPIELTKIKALKQSISIVNPTNKESLIIFPADTSLPAHFQLPVQLSSESLEGSFQVALNPLTPADSVITLGEINFNVPEEAKTEILIVDFSIPEDNSGLIVQVIRSSNKEVLNSLNIPLSP